MNKWKGALFITLAISFSVVVVLLYGMLDQGISFTYLEVSYDDQVKANKVLGNLIVKGGQEYSQNDFLHLLRQQYPDAFIVENENKISMGPNAFVFEKNRLVLAR